MMILQLLRDTITLSGECVEIIECRRCGYKLDPPGDICSECGSSEISWYEV